MDQNMLKGKVHVLVPCNESSSFQVISKACITPPEIHKEQVTQENGVQKSGKVLKSD